MQSQTKDKLFIVLEKYHQIYHVFHLLDPLDTRPLSKREIENYFLSITEKKTLEILQKHQYLDPVIRQLKSWHQYKTKPIEADITILGNKTLKNFRKFNNTSNNENTGILEYQTCDFKLPCIPLSIMLIAFHTSQSSHTKGHSGAEKNIFKFHTKISFPKCTSLDKSTMQ